MGNGEVVVRYTDKELAAIRPRYAHDLYVKRFLIPELHRRIVDGRRDKDAKSLQKGS